MKKRILFVDDDPMLARVYVTVLQDQSAHWEVRSATSGSKALELAEKAPFDIVVTDYRMPGMTGLQLVEEIRKRNPRTSRVILSGIHDQEEIARCLNSTHQFIGKPVDLTTLRATLTRICALDNLLMDEKLRSLVGQFQALPSFPALYVEIVKELSSADPSIERIAEIVALDPGMTAKMLQIVNSAAFGLARKISSPFEAVQFLGTATVRSLVLSVHVFFSFDRKVEGFSMEEFWQHALRCAALSRNVSRSAEADAAISEEAYIAGMLHDVGKLMLVTGLPEQFNQALRLAAEHRVPLHEVEPRVYGATHASVGAYLLGLWGLPAPIVEAVAFHHTPSQSDTRIFGPLTAVHAANELEHECLTVRESAAANQWDAEYLNGVGVAEQMETWRAEAVRLFAARAD